MTPDDFEQYLLQDGFTTPVHGHYPPGCFNPAHTHPFEVRGLILRGEMTIAPTGGAVTHCQAGDIFTMPLSAEHIEEVGPTGVEYLWGRRNSG